MNCSSCVDRRDHLGQAITTYWTFHEHALHLYSVVLHTLPLVSGIHSLIQSQMIWSFWFWTSLHQFLPRDVMQARPMPSCGVCLSVCLSPSLSLSLSLSLCMCARVRVSVTYVDSVQTNKHIFKMFSPSGSHTILVFPYQTSWQYSDTDPPP